MIQTDHEIHNKIRSSLIKIISKILKSFSFDNFSKAILFLFLFVNTNCSQGIIALFEDDGRIMSGTTIPEAIENLPLDQSIEPNLNITVSGSDVVDYQYKIVGNSSPCTGGGYNGTWIDKGTPITDALVSDGFYKICVITRDASLNEMSEDLALEHSWIQGIVTADLNNTPDPVSDATSLNVTVSGDLTEEYQYKIINQTDICTGGGYNGTWIDVATPITDAIDFDGDYKLCVISRDMLQYEQTEDSATEYLWTAELVSWKLEVTTSGSNENMTVVFVSPVTMYLDWGDGSTDITGATSITHTYASAGVYTLKIRGQTAGIKFNDVNTRERLTGMLSIIQGISGLTTLENLFSGCTNLTGSIPPGLFDNCPNVTNFKNTFNTCSGLTGLIPAGLFDNCPNAWLFRATFIRCSGLTGSIPAGLFDNNPNASDFLNTFQSCSGLTAIPDGLFDNNPLARIFMYTFQHCTGLTYVPSDLFDNNPNVITFQQTFANCTGITSSVPELWVDTATKFPDLVLPKYAGGCFSNVPNASNWSEIPSMWGGPL